MSLTVLEKVGIVFIVVVAVQLVRRLLQLLYDHVIAPALHMNVDFTKYKGTWAGGCHSVCVCDKRLSRCRGDRTSVSKMPRSCQ